MLPVRLSDTSRGVTPCMCVCVYVHARACVFVLVRMYMCVVRQGGKQLHFRHTIGHTGSFALGFSVRYSHAFKYLIEFVFVSLLANLSLDGEKKHRPASYYASAQPCALFFLFVAMQDCPPNQPRNRPIHSNLHYLHSHSHCDQLHHLHYHHYHDHQARACHKIDGGGCNKGSF